MDDATQSIENRKSKIKNAIVPAAAILVFAAAVFLRVGSLDARVFHGDEAVNSVKFAQLADLDRNVYQDESYRYDPHEFHGPALPYLTLPAKWITGDTTYAQTDEAFYRSVTVVCGLGVVVMTLLLGRFIGWYAAVAAGLLVAVSPAMVFFSRYYIHEMPLVLFTVCAVYFGMAYFARGKWYDAARCGACVGLMHATKETFVLSLFAIAVASGIVWLMERRSRPLAISTLFKPMHMVGAVAAMLVVSTVLFSQFGSNPRGIVDSVLTYKSWFEIGTQGGVGAGDIHNHPFGFYLERLFWYPFRSTIHISELLVGVLAIVGLVVSLGGWGLCERVRPAARFVALYGFILLFVYCVIPYKTPWSILSAYHALILTAGVGAVALVKLIAGASLSKPRLAVAALVALALLGGTYHMARQNRIVNGVYAGDPRNPWVYAHPHSDVRELAERVGSIARISMLGTEESPGTGVPSFVCIDVQYSWPLPFYLRRHLFDAKWGALALPNELADIVIADSVADAAWAKSLVEYDYRPEVLMHRPNVPLYVYIRKDLWEAYLAKQEEASP